jgi:lipid A ethanolaminephosphotransferase
MSLFAAPYVFKPAIIVLLLITASASYFTSEYGTVVDGGMLKNVLQTNTNEVADLLTIKLALYVLALGVLPSALLSAFPIAYRPLRSKLRFRARWALVAGVVCIVLGLVFSQNILSVFRQHRLLLGLFAPLNVVSASAELARKSFRFRPDGTGPFGDDAQKSSAWSTRRKRSVTVIVVGETARADHFALNGYPRATNPLLAKIPNLVSFTQAYSCGTNTGHSLPCMFSGLGANSFNNERAARQENLLDILKRAGFSVLWRENQAGCYGVCKRRVIRREPRARSAGENREHAGRHGHCPAHDGQPWPDLLQAISAGLRTLPACLQGEPVQSLQSVRHHQQLRQHARL